MTSPRPPTTGAASGQRAGGAPEARYDADYFDTELHHDHWFTNNAAKRMRRWHEVVRMLEPAPRDRILEIGCATGEHALRLAREVREVVGIDLAPAAIERARLRAVQDGVHNARFEICDAANLAPWGDAAFDKVAAIDFVEHVDDDALAAILREVRRVLVPGGRLAIYTPCATHYVERLKARNLVLRQIAGHIAVRAPEPYLKLIAAAGLEVEAIWFLPSDYPGFGAVDRALARLPVVGRWFRFRICAVATKPGP
jgi:cyclopropane fatty-acyl-phospholipid synthase-like methyltransferase